ncbi:MAG: tetratricopeptide repeat protein [Candidatus Tectomicrobia bacterium]|nr:tetratricopeptide repeat protein [Candidatus Tectomicrobia bacterium]
MEESRLEQFKQLAELEPEDDLVRFGLGTAYFDEGQYEEATKEFQQAIRLNPDYSAAYRDLGKALEKAGRPEEAKTVYTQGIEVADRKGDIQTMKEMQIFLKRLER